MTTVLPGFDFGRGPTPLDRFVHIVLSPSVGDDRYEDACRFTTYSWQCAQEMYYNTESRHGSLVYTGTTVIPEWLQEITHKASSLDPQMGGPTLMTAYPANVDWFALAAEHPTDIELSVDFEDAPTLAQIKESVSLAQEAGLDYRLGVLICPATAEGEPLSVCLDELVLVGVQRESSTVASISEALGGVNPEAANCRPSAGTEAWGWEWMSYWPSTT